MDEMYQFQVLYERAMPGVVTFRYFVVGANGKGAGIGVQGGESCVALTSSLSSCLVSGADVMI